MFRRGAISSGEVIASTAITIEIERWTEFLKSYISNKHEHREPELLLLRGSLFELYMGVQLSYPQKSGPRYPCIGEI